MIMKRLIAGVGGAFAFLIFAFFVFLWVSGFEMVSEVVRGVPLYLGKVGQQIHVNYLLVLVILVGCPIGVGILSVRLLLFACRKNKDKGKHANPPYSEPPVRSPQQ